MNFADHILPTFDSLFPPSFELTTPLKPVSIHKPMIRVVLATKTTPNRRICCLVIMVPIITGCDGLTVDPIKLKIKVTNKVETWGENMKQASSVKVRVHISYFQFSLS